MKSILAFLAAVLAFTCAGAAEFPAVRVEKINERVVALLGPTDVPNRENGGYINNNLAILAAFPGAKVVATDASAREIEHDGRGMVNWMKRRTGLPLDGTQPVKPQVVIPAGTRQTMEIEGVRMELIGMETAHTKGDMMVWLPDDGVLASGDILVSTINPNFSDGNLKKLLGVVGNILQLPLKTVLPGHGPLMGRAEVEEFHALAGEFYRTVEAVYKAGGAESDVRKKLDLQRWQKLGRFEDMMGPNISTVWRQVEDDNF